MTEQNEKDIGRREFLARTGKAAAAIAIAAGVAYKAYDREGPQAGIDASELVTLPDFSVPQIDGKTMSVVKGSDRVVSVGRAVKALGGMERFVKKGETVVIKPNVAFATAPFLGATARPELVAEVVRLCYEVGAKKVIVTDNPINDPASCFLHSGVGKAAADAGAKVILPKEHLFKHTTLEGGRLIKDWPLYYGPLSKADKLIGISPVKDHARSGASMSMKNWYGLLGGRRNVFHQDINTIISELATMVNPSLVILDGVETMMTNGPTGGTLSDLKRTDTLIASCDMVAADSYGCSLLDLKVSDLPYLSKAEKAGVGTTDYQSLKPIFTT